MDGLSSSTARVLSLEGFGLRIMHNDRLVPPAVEVMGKTGLCGKSSEQAFYHASTCPMKNMQTCSSSCTCARSGHGLGVTVCTGQGGTALLETSTSRACWFSGVILWLIARGQWSEFED